MNACGMVDAQIAVIENELLTHNSYRSLSVVSGLPTTGFFAQRQRREICNYGQGGFGAAREVCELILKAHGRRDDLIELPSIHRCTRDQNYLEPTSDARRLTRIGSLTIFFSPFERVWRNGSASASQAEGCGFESRRPLQIP